jgi:hypothetical protein
VLNQQYMRANAAQPLSGVTTRRLVAGDGAPASMDWIESKAIVPRVVTGKPSWCRRRGC